VNKHIIITARSNSSRLRNKILAQITKKHKTIDVIINRALKTKFPICLATSDHKSDDKLVNYVKRNYKIKIFRGSKNNKISRWVKCIKKLNADCVGLVDGDDLSFDYTLYNKYLKKFSKKNRCDIYKFPNNIVTGSFTYVVTAKALNLINAKTEKLKKVDVIEFFLKYVKNIEEIKVKKQLKNKNIRLTMDYIDDLEFFKVLYKNLNITEKTSKIISFLEKNVYIKNLNYHLEESWRKNQLKEIRLHEKNKF
tara:strand:+ start:1470 stop:2225 length:756 start_codon:yes stop_codon:yes gene_type:complete